MKRALLFLAAAAIVAACSSSSSPPPSSSADQAGQACTSAAQCYPGLQEAGTLHGAVQCLDRVPGGYCTHLCATDADCCAVPGECLSGFREVCAPFESTGQNYCFLSCEAADISTATNGQVTDETLYCQKYANSAFGCRSTGGGKTNRKVCTP